ncbi:hypothetical protein V1509DRAFT_634828 [Lipomyces kononenkoae]
MESQDKHRKISDARRLIKYQRKGHKLSAQDLQLVEIYREKERLRQQRLRNDRRLAFPPKKRGRKPLAKPAKTDAAVSVVPKLASDLSDRIEKQKHYQEDTPQNVASAVDMSINGCNGYRGICFVPIDLQFLVNKQHTMNSQKYHEALSPTPSQSMLQETTNIPEQHRSTLGQLNVPSSSIYPAATASLSIFDVYSLAASGTSPAPSCTSSSSINSSSVQTISSSQSPECSAFPSQITTSDDECQVLLTGEESTSATCDHLLTLHVGCPSGVDPNDSSRSPRDFAGSQPGSGEACLGVLSHSIWNSPQISSKRCELPPEVQSTTSTTYFMSV